MTFTRPLHWLLLFVTLGLTTCGPAPTTATPLATTTSTSPPATAAGASSPAASPGRSPAPALATPSRLALLAEAEAAYNQHDLTTAFRLYRQAATDPDLTDPTTDGRSAGPDLRDFAGFRIIVLDAIVGQDDDARTVLERLRPDADRPFPRLALVFWDTYGMTAEAGAACRQVNQLVREEPDRFLRPLNEGANGLGLTPDTVCTIVSPG